MIKYPMMFSARIQTDSCLNEKWEITASGNTGTCNIPLEFGGSGGAFSPEDLFLLAISNCFIATFKVFASASNLKFNFINIDSILFLDRDDCGQPYAKHSKMKVYIDGVQDISRTMLIFKKTVRSGILLKSVKTELEFEYSINGEVVS